MDEATLRREAQDVLRCLGPLAPVQLARELARSDPQGPLTDAEALDPERLRDVLLDETAEEGEFLAFPLADGRLCDLDHLLEGLTLTHLLTEDERRTQTLMFEDDLLPLLALSPDGRSYPLATGEVANHSSAGWEQLTGPPGWLPDTSVLVVRVVDGRLELTGRGDAPPLDDVVVERLERTLEALRRHRDVIDEVELIIEARSRFPRLFSRPQAPLSELLAAAGIRSTDHGLLDADEPGPDEEIGELVEHLREDHQLEVGEVVVVLGVLADVQQLNNHVLEAGMTQARALGSDPMVDLDTIDLGELDDEQLARLTTEAMESIDLEVAGEQLRAVLADTEMSAAVVEDVVGSEPLAAASFLALLEASRPDLSGRTARANEAWVRARVLELIADDHAHAERELRRAHELDEQHVNAAFDLAIYLADRGQAGAALGLLRRIEGPQVEELMQLLARYAVPGPTSAGRNEPCPCGSGRKHKACCQASNGWPLQERIEWLWGKVMTFLTSPRATDLMTPITYAAGQSPGPAAVYDVAVANIALFEGGLLTEMCERRGSLLPADEVGLLRSWTQVRAAAYELVEVSSGDRLTVRDLSTGDRISFVDHSLAAGDLSPGTAMLAWMVMEPDGPVPSIGVVAVPDARRDDLRRLLDDEPSAFELAVWCRWLHTPPRLATTAGDPLVLTSQVFAVSDPQAARAALAEHLEGGEDALLAHEEYDGRRWPTGSVTVREKTLTVSTTSAPRAAWFAELITEVVPDAELVDVERIPADDLAGYGMRDPGDEGEDDGLLGR